MDEKTKTELKELHDAVEKIYNDGGIVLIYTAAGELFFKTDGLNQTEIAYAYVLFERKLKEVILNRD